jgi:hypothetical protein
MPKRMEAAKRIWANPVSSMGLPSPGWEPQEREQMSRLFLEISVLILCVCFGKHRAIDHIQQSGQ